MSATANQSTSMPNKGLCNQGVGHLGIVAGREITSEVVIHGMCSGCLIDIGVVVSTAVKCIISLGSLPANDLSYKNRIALPICIFK